MIGEKPRINFSTDERNKIAYAGPLDFSFIVHARDVRDILRTYPHLDGHSEEHIFRAFGEHHGHVGSEIRVPIGGKILRGELIGVPFIPGNLRLQLRLLRESLSSVLEYCSTRQTRIVGLGALLPSMTDFGRSLIDRAKGIGITTGHSFTAHALAEHVRRVEALLGGPQNVAIVGAAGSTGRAFILALLGDGIERRMTLVDVPERLRSLSDLVASRPEDISITADLSEIRHSAIVVCATNATSAIIRSEHLAHGAIVIDDSQPENISLAVASNRPDIVVVKCLARVPQLQCPFDFGLFSHPPLGAKQEIVFTCLAEVVALAASGHAGHFTIGRPTEDNISRIAKLANDFGIGIAPLHSFPEIGELKHHPRFASKSRSVIPPVPTAFPLETPIHAIL